MKETKKKSTGTLRPFGVELADELSPELLKQVAGGRPTIYNEYPGGPVIVCG